MIPNKSNTTNGCDNTSSNCVIWQGPDLTCVDICNGDTISDVVAKLAEQLCECCGLTGEGKSARSASSIDIRTVNQLCLESDYGKASNVQILLNNIIDKLCKSTGQSEADVCSCSMPIPECLRENARNYLNTTDTISTMVLHDPNTNKGYAHFLAEQLCLSVVAINDVKRQMNSLDGRVLALESKSNRKTTAVLPKVTLAIGGSGRPQSLDSAVVATNNALNLYATLIGTTGQINTALAAAPQLGNRNRLSSAGLMSSARNWISVPRNLAQSFQNLWLTMLDTRNALENIKETVANPLCEDITFKVNATLKKDAVGSVTEMNFDFSETSIPTQYNDCNSGTKITVTDSSLNTISFNVNVAGLLQSSNKPYRLTSNQMGALDLSSNYSVRVEFCATNGDNQCSEIQNFTVHNETACPTLTIGTVTNSTIPFVVSSLKYPENKGYTVTVECNTLSGSLIDSRSFTSFRSNLTGTFSNLNSETQYKVSTKVTKDGIKETADCPEHTVSTSAPVCSSTIYTPASIEWKTSVDDLTSGGNTLEIATYNDGATQTKWQVGFDDTNTPIVVQAGTTGVTGWNHEGEFINDELPTNPLTITGLTGSPLGPTGIGRTDKESGWKYIGTIKSQSNQMLYVYASINTTTHTVNQVVFACNCSGLYLDTEQPVFYVENGGLEVIKINAVGYTAGSGTYTWNISTQPSHGSLSFQTGSPSKDHVNYVYRQDGSTMLSDSFVISLTNECGTTVGTKYISILPAKRLPWTDTEIIVFFDTNSMTTADAIKIKNSFNAIVAGFSGSSPSISYVAVDGATSGDYLKHVKATVENTGGSFPNAAFLAAHGAAISVPAAGTWWTNVMQSGATRPAYWTAGKAELPTSVHVISFVSQNSSHGTYGAATVSFPAAWGGQPTTNSGVGVDRYQEDYDAIIDITSSAAPTGAWATACQAQVNFPWLSGSIPFTVSQTVVPIINDVAGPTAAVALQTAAAIQGETLLNIQEMMGAKFGLQKYRFDGTSGINLSTYLQSGIASTNIPYSVTTSGASNVMTGLKDINTFNTALHSYIENGIEFDLTLNSDIITYFRGMFGLNPTGSAGEPTGVGAFLMQNAGISARYAESAVSAAQACTDALTVGNLINVYNKTGVQFDNSCKAYKTLSGAVNEQSEYELVNGRWYAGENLAAGRQRAQYSTTPPYWSTPVNC